jgi:Aspartic acid proteinase inhibitor
MKNSSRVVTLLVALSLAFSFAIVGLAQNRPSLGGYKSAPTDDAEVVEAAEHALSERGEKEGVSLKLVSVERAERQVVAGTNFRLCLKVAIDGEEDDSGETQDVKVVVFRSLQKEYSLKSWEVAECSESN